MNDFDNPVPMSEPLSSFNGQKATQYATADPLHLAGLEVLCQFEQYSCEFVIVAFSLRDHQISLTRFCSGIPVQLVCLPLTHAVEMNTRPVRAHSRGAPAVVVQLGDVRMRIPGCSWRRIQLLGLVRRRIHSPRAAYFVPLPKSACECPDDGSDEACPALDPNGLEPLERLCAKISVRPHGVAPPEELTPATLKARGQRQRVDRPHSQAAAVVSARVVRICIEIIC